MASTQLLANYTCEREAKNAVGMYYGSKDRLYIGHLAESLQRVTSGNGRWGRLLQNSKLAILWYRVQKCTDCNYYLLENISMFFVCVVYTNHKNISTTKISRSTDLPATPCSHCSMLLFKEFYVIEVWGLASPVVCCGSSTICCQLLTGDGFKPKSCCDHEHTCLWD